MRSLALVLLLAACGARPEAGAGNETAKSSVPDDRIDCLIEGSTAFEHNCVVESSGTPEGRVLTIRKPDGGFRRLHVTTDGTGVVAADGAERAVVTLLSGDRIEVAIGGDRFRLPARVRAR